MSRKHYIEIATVLAQHGASETLLFDIAKIFENDNPRFEVSRFLAKVIEVKDKLRLLKLKQNDPVIGGLYADDK
jgi:hypothetical protein